MEINLTQEEIDAINEMGINIENYIKRLCASHIQQSVDKEFLIKPLSEKIQLIGGKYGKTES